MDQVVHSEHVSEAWLIIIDSKVGLIMHRIGRKVFAVFGFFVGQSLTTTSSGKRQKFFEVDCGSLFYEDCQIPYPVFLVIFVQKAQCRLMIPLSSASSGLWGVGLAGPLIVGLSLFQYSNFPTVRTPSLFNGKKFELP